MTNIYINYSQYIEHGQSIDNDMVKYEGDKYDFIQTVLRYIVKKGYN